MRNVLPNLPSQLRLDLQALQWVNVSFDFCHRPCFGPLELFFLARRSGVAELGL